MKDPIKEKTMELMDLVRGSDVYLDYHAALDSIRKKKELYEKLNAFRRRSLELDFVEDPVEKSEELDKLYTTYGTVLTDPLTVEFLACEQKLVRMMKGIYDTIARHINLDLSHLD